MNKVITQKQSKRNLLRRIIANKAKQNQIREIVCELLREVFGPVVFCVASFVGFCRDVLNKQKKHREERSPKRQCACALIARLRLSAVGSLLCCCAFAVVVLL